MTQPLLCLLGADHGGVALRTELAAWLHAKGYAAEIFGAPDSATRTDGPLVIDTMAPRILAAPAGSVLGIFVCRTGGNPSIRANRYNGIRAVSVFHPRQGELAKTHGQANMLCFAGDITPTATAIAILEAYLTHDFIGTDPAYLRRVAQLDAPLATLPA